MGGGGRVGAFSIPYPYKCLEKGIFEENLDFFLQKNDICSEILWNLSGFSQIWRKIKKKLLTPLPLNFFLPLPSPKIFG